MTMASTLQCSAVPSFSTLSKFESHLTSQVSFSGRIPLGFLNHSSVRTCKQGDLGLKTKYSCQRKPVSAGLLDFFVRPKKPTVEQLNALKQELLDAIAPLNRGVKATEEDKEKVEELASKLEALNPTKNPVESPLINGKWKLVYTTSESILGAKKPEFLRPSGPIYQCIDNESLQALNIESWPFFNQVQATLTPTSKSSVDVKFDTFKIFSIINVQAPDSARGTLEITYLDDDMRISRGNRGNLFVLIMEDASFRLSNPKEETVEE